jgi:hypothetical protein
MSVFIEYIVENAALESLRAAEWSRHRRGPG